MSTDSTDRGAGVLDSWTSLVRRRWRPGLGTFATILGLAVVLVFFTPPVYRAEALLRLGEPPPMSGVSPNTGIFGLFNLGGDPFSNDLELLSSRTLTEGVVLDGALNATLDGPRGWHRDSLFQRFSTTTGTTRATYELRWAGEGIRVRRIAPDDALVGTVAPGATLEVGGLVLAPRAWRAGMPREVRVRSLPFGEAVHRARGGVKVERARREANVIRISFDSPDPGVAREVVRSAVERFVELRTAIQRRESDQTVDSLRVVADATLEELRRAEEAMEALQRQTGLVAPDAQSQTLIERYSEAVAQLETARTEFAGVTALLRRVESAAEPAAAWADLAAYPAFLQHETVGEFLSGLSALTERRAELASRRTETSREHRVLLEQIERRDASLRAIAHGYRTALEERIGLLEAQVAEMRTFLAGVPGRVIELGRHQRSVRVLSEVLVLTEQRLRQEQLRQALTFANVQVIDPPALQYRPVWPRKTLGLGGGFLLALAGGLLSMVVAERADRTGRRAREARGILDAPVRAVRNPNGEGVAARTPGDGGGAWD